MGNITLTEAGMRIVKLLVGHPPQTMTDLIDGTGVTRTAVTEKLNELVAAGFVNRGIEPLRGRGRPRYVYSSTNALLLLLLANSQNLVAPAIWKAIDDIGGDKLTRKVLRRVGRTLADHYNPKITAKRPKQRLRKMAELLREEGGLIEAVNENGRLVLYKRSCPFISMLDEKRSVCCVDREMMSAVVGRRVHRTSSRHEGDPCCAFEIANGR